MSAPRPLARLEQIVDRSVVAADIEALLPVGVRPRQLSVRTLLVGMLLAAADGRPAHLRRVHQALLELPERERRRLAITAEWKHGPHLLTYRQVERTFALVVAKLAKDQPDGSPSDVLSQVLDALMEASVTVLGEPASSSYAVDWTDQQTFARPPRAKRGGRANPEPVPDDAEPVPDDAEPVPDDAEPVPDDAEPVPDAAEPGARSESARCADPEAAWGHRRGDAPGQKDESFFGYYTQIATLVRDEHGPQVPELVRRIQIASCDVDPPGALVPVLERMAAGGIEIGDLLADSGYSYRVAEDWALPLRRLGVRLVHDLHPNDQGMQGTHEGAIRSGGNLYCPATPKALLELRPLARGANAKQTEAHDRLCQELSSHKLSPITGHDPDGYRRVLCPAVQGKLRCPLRPASMELDHTRPQVPRPPEHPPKCCRQKTITVPPSVNAKTAQKHDYPSAAHRRSYTRRSAAERAYATVKDPATNDLGKGWCRLTGLTPIALFTATTFVARNLRIADSFAARQAEDKRRAANGLPPKQRKRRRQTTDDLIGAANAPP
jgi:hypothetical protein